MAKVRKRFIKGIELSPEDLTAEDLAREGELAYDSDSDRLKYRNASATQEVVDTDSTQTLENKTIDATSATGNNTLSADSNDIVYDNAVSGLTATNVKAAVDELKVGLDNQNEASEINYDNTTSGLTATNVKAAIDEVEGRLDTAESNISTNTTNLAETDQNVDDLITLSGVAENSTDLGTFTGSTIPDNSTNKAALQSLETEVEQKIEADSVDTLSNKTLDNSNSITVQDANLTIQDDLDNTKQAKIQASGITTGTTRTYTLPDIDGTLSTAASTETLTNKTIDGNNNTISNLAHGSEVDEPSTNVHGVGVGNDIVGTGTTQTLTNKTISGASIQDPSRLDVKKDTQANLETYATTATNGQFVFATDTKTAYQIIDNTLAPVGGGGGGLDVYYAEDFNTLSNTSDFSTGNNATFLGGGTLAGTLALETTTEIAGTQSISYTQASGSLNDYFASELIDVDLKQQNNDSGMTFYFTYDGDTNDGKFVVWDATNSQELTSGVELVENSSKANRYALSFYVPATCTQIQWGYQVLVENIGAELVIDDVEFTLDPFVYKELLDSQSFRYTTDGTQVSGVFRFSTLDFSNGSNIVSYSDDGTNGTRVTANKSCVITVSAGVGGPTSNRGYFIRLNGNRLVTEISEQSVAVDGASASVTLDLSQGDYIDVSSTQSGFTSGELVVNAQASTEHVITPAKSNLTDWKDGGVLSPSTGAFGTTASNKVLYRQVGQNLEMDLNVYQTTSGTAGSGVYLFDLPNSHTFNTDLVTTSTTTTDNQSATSLGTVHFTNGDGNTTWEATAYAYDSNSFFFMIGAAVNDAGSANVNTQDAWGSGSFALNTAVLTIKGQLSVPVAEFSSESTFLAAIPTPKTAYIKDVKPSGTDGGTFTSGAWQTRDLNTLEGDTGFVSLLSNQFTLQPGKYEIEASAPGVLVADHKLKLRNITDSSDDIIGSSERIGSTQDASTSSFINGGLTITSTKTFEIQHRCETTKTTNGFGAATTFGVDEIYTQVKITKVK